MNRLLVFAAFVLFVGPALAQEKKTVSVSYQQELEMLQTLANLDGERDRVLGTGANEKTVRGWLEFDTAFVIKKFENMAVLRADLANYDAMRQAEIKKYLPSSGRFDEVKCSNPNDRSTCRMSEAEFQATERISAIYTAKHPVTLNMFSLDDLKLEKNRISGVDLTALCPMLTVTWCAGKD